MYVGRYVCVCNIRVYNFFISQEQADRAKGRFTTKRDAKQDRINTNTSHCIEHLHAYTAPQDVGLPETFPRLL